MNFVRNGVHNGTARKTKINKVKPEKKKPTKKKGDILSKGENLLLMEEQKRIIKWLGDIKIHNSFGKEWSLFVLHEIVLQCMGKLPVISFGRPVQLFNPKEAVKAVKLGAVIEGSVNMNTSSFSGRGFGAALLPGTNNSEETNESPKSDEERTIEVYDILSEAGVMVPVNDSKDIKLEAV
jgi:hypothetical protein